MVTLLLSAPGSSPSPAAEYRMISGLDLSLFGCMSNPGYYLFSSEADLDEQIKDAPVRHCGATDMAPLKSKFLQSLRPAGLQWREEALVVLQEWYGTGMAKAHIDLRFAAPGVLEATVVWKVPPPPLTPDTASFSCAFAVKKSAVSKIVIRGQSPKPITLNIEK